MIPASFDYVSPHSLSEAINLLTSNPEAKILAGGQSLIPLMRFRLAAPALLIDINPLSELGQIREEDGWLVLGAMVREADLEHSSLINSRYPLLADTTKMIADPLVRNMSTVGGNLAHADPANDHPATMLAYGAEIFSHGPNGERRIPATDFFIAPFESALAADDILTEIRIPQPEPRSGGAYQKVERKVGDFAAAAVAVQISLDEAGRIAHAGIGLTNVGLTPIKAADAENSLIGAEPSLNSYRTAADLASQVAEPVEDLRGSADYKRSLVRTLTVRALRAAVSRANGGSS